MQQKRENFVRQTVNGIDVNRLISRVNRLMLVNYWKITELHHIFLSDYFWHDFSSVSPFEVQFEVLESYRDPIVMY